MSDPRTRPPIAIVGSIHDLFPECSLAILEEDEDDDEQDVNGNVDGDAGPGQVSPVMEDITPRIDRNNETSQGPSDDSAVRHEVTTKEPGANEGKHKQESKLDAVPSPMDSQSEVVTPRGFDHAAPHIRYSDERSFWETMSKASSRESSPMRRGKQAISIFGDAEAGDEDGLAECDIVEAIGSEAVAQVVYERGFDRIWYAARNAREILSMFHIQDEIIGCELATAGHQRTVKPSLRLGITLLILRVSITNVSQMYHKYS